MSAEQQRLLGRIRILIGIVIAGLVISGLTAFPLEYELELLHRFVSTRPMPPALVAWIAKVHHGLEATYAAYPFMGYGTDWLAFAHLVIAFFFVGPLVDPARNIWIIHAGQIACVAVIPIALICGEIREIPMWWRVIDCSFGVFGFIPLWLASRSIRQLAATNAATDAAGQP